MSYKCRICVCAHSSNECDGLCTLNTFAYYCGISTCISNIFTCLLIGTWMFTWTLSPFPTYWSSFCCIFIFPFPKLLVDMVFQWEKYLFLIVKVIDDNCNDILVKFQLHMLKLWGFLLLWIIHFSSQSLVFCQHPNTSQHIQAFDFCTKSLYLHSWIHFLYHFWFSWHCCLFLFWNQ